MVEIKTEPKIQGEKPKTGNVVGVQRTYTGKKRSGISISAMQNQKKEEQEAEGLKIYPINQELSSQQMN